MTVAGDSALSLTLPLTSSQRRELRADQLVELSGLVYTARDAAHQRLVAAQEQDVSIWVADHSFRQMPSMECTGRHTILATLWGGGVA